MGYFAHLSTKIGPEEKHQYILTKNTLHIFYYHLFIRKIQIKILCTIRDL